MAMVRPPLRDRVVILLLSFWGYDDDVEVPAGLTQKGLSERVGASRAHVSQILAELKEGDMVTERLCHVTGARRRLKAYFLTGEGREYGIKLRRALIGEKILLRDGDGEVREVALEDAPEGDLPEDWDLTDVLRHMDDEGVCDPSTAAGAEEGGTVKEEGAEEGEEGSGDEGEGTGQDTTVPGGAMGEAPVHDTPQPRPWTGQEGQQSPIRNKKVSRIGFVLGSAFIFGSMLLIMLAVSMFEAFFCAMVPIMFFVGIGLIGAYYLSLRGAGLKELERIDRRMIMTAGLLMAYTLALLLTMALEGTEPEEGLGVLRLLLAVNIPLIFVLLAGFVIPAWSRGQIGLTLGTFLFALSVAAWIAPGAFPWLALHPILWLVTGVMALMVAMEVARPGARDIGLGVTGGMGLFIAVVAVALIHHFRTGGAQPDVWGGVNMISTVLMLWLALGVVMVFMRYTPEGNLDILSRGLGISALVALGMAFILFGIWFLKNEGMEGAVDLLIGFPVMYYGFMRVRDLRGRRLRIVVAILAFTVVLEVLTLGMVLDLY